MTHIIRDFHEEDKDLLVALRNIYPGSFIFMKFNNYWTLQWYLSDSTILSYEVRTELRIKIEAFTLGWELRGELFPVKEK